MDFYDISWLKYVMINVLSIGIYLLSFSIAYFLLTRKVETNRLFISSILAFFAAVPIASLVITSQLVNATQFSDLVFPVSTALCLVFWSGIGVVTSWISCNFEMKQRQGVEPLFNQNKKEQSA